MNTLRTWHHHCTHPCGDCRIEGIDLVEMKAQQEAVLPGYAAAQGLPQRLLGSLHAMIGQAGLANASPGVLERLLTSQNRPGGGGLPCTLSHRRRASEFSVPGVKDLSAQIIVSEIGT